jgi:hypothetical protein
LFVVLDRLLPAKLNQISDRVEGSMQYPADPDQDLVGTVNTGTGTATMDILVERIERGKAGDIWLFSSKTLAAIPELYRRTTSVTPAAVLPAFLVNTQIAHIELFQWLAVLLGLPLLYFATGLLNRILGILTGAIRRRPNPQCLPKPVRLLLLALVIRWMLNEITLPLLMRQFWSSTATMFTIGGMAWLVILLNGAAETWLRRRLGQRNLSGIASIVRFTRRLGDLLVLLVGVLSRCTILV